MDSLPEILAPRIDRCSKCGAVLGNRNTTGICMHCSGDGKRRKTGRHEFQRGWKAAITPTAQANACPNCGKCCRKETCTVTRPGQAPVLQTLLRCQSGTCGVVTKTEEAITV